ncbi:MAG: hypothetical protein HZB67_02630, partial [Candidatus Aenigmarchaeota archaeon]|nr:hypothetical protein [Candidatus Aenigmarchaeota archaeon]
MPISRRRLLAATRDVSIAYSAGQAISKLAAAYGLYRAATALSGCGGGGGGGGGSPKSIDGLANGKVYIGKAVILERLDDRYVQGRIIASSEIPDITKVRKVTLNFRDMSGDLIGFEEDLRKPKWGNDGSGNESSYVFPFSSFTGRSSGEVRLVSVVTETKDGKKITDEPGLIVPVPGLKSGLPVNSADGYQIAGADKLLAAHKGPILVRYKGDKV